MPWFVASIVLFGGSCFFALRHLTRGRLQVESVLGRMAGYGYRSGPVGTDWRTILRQIGRVSPGGRGARAEGVRRKLAAAGWSKRYTPEDIAGAKILFALGAYFLMLLADSAERPAVGCGRRGRRCAGIGGLPVAAGCDRYPGAWPARQDRGRSCPPCSTC